MVKNLNYKNINIFNQQENFFFENKFYLNSDPSRLKKLIVHYELYKKIQKIKGAVIECGVFKGSSLIRWATFRFINDKYNNRTIIGFDTFNKFPKTNFLPDKIHRKKFIDEAGEKSLSVKKLKKIFYQKKFKNIKLIEGDIIKTIPRYIKNNPDLKIALLHIDVDIYEPTKVILEYLFKKVVKGGIIIFDDFNVFPGETKAVIDFFKSKKYKLRKLAYSKLKPYYIIKK